MPRSMLQASSIAIVLDAYRPERGRLLELLSGLSEDQWQRPTECPAYSVKGVATHVLGDDLSLLSRQRDRAENGLALLSYELPGLDFRTLLDTFNDRWVSVSSFLSSGLLIELLGLTGEWTASYYEHVDPEGPGEAVGLFGAAQESSSPFWQAIAREYLERWIHHSQIRRALGRPSLAERELLAPGLEVAAAIARMEPGIPANPGDDWTLGPVKLGPAEQAAAVLTRAHTADEVRSLVRGPADVVDLIAEAVARP